MIVFDRNERSVAAGSSDIRTLGPHNRPLNHFSSLTTLDHELNNASMLIRNLSGTAGVEPAIIHQKLLERL